MSNGLIIFIDKNIKFKKDETIEAISRIEGIYNLSIDKEILSEFILSCEYDYQEYSVIIDFCADLKAIFIDRASQAGFKFAFQLQQLITQPTRIIDCSYSFDISLPEIQSLEELEQKVMEARNQNSNNTNSEFE
jgi:hypothetical protein